jgi:hypothetical protein
MALVIASAVAAGCSKTDSPTTPTAVTNNQATPGPTLPNSSNVTAGAPAGQSTTTDGGGHYTLTNISPCALTLRISAVAYVTQSMDLTLTDNRVANVTLAPAPFQTQGFAFDIDSNSALAGITMTGDSVSSTTSSQSGTFIAVAANESTAPRAVQLAGPGVVQRHTYVRVPGPELTLGLLPAAFDLTAFDQMLRTPMLYRWTQAPPLILERRTLHFTSADASSATAETDVMTDAETAALEADLQAALGPMTGGAFGSFAGVERTTAATGDPVNLLNTGSITVTRMAGLTAATGFWGFGRYQVQSDGTVIGGIVMLDRDFERSGNPSLRTLRTHELGHALGYNHVTTRSSVMSPAANVDPTAWDLSAFRIAFARVPGNRSPDDDPVVSMNSMAGAATWSRPIK